MTEIEEAPEDTLVRVILEHDCNMTAAAKELGIAKSTLYSRLKSLDLSVDKLRKLKENVPDILARVDAELVAERTTSCPACGEGMSKRRDSGTHRNTEGRFRWNVYDCGSSLNRVNHLQQTSKCYKIAERNARRAKPAEAVA